MYAGLPEKHVATILAFGNGAGTVGINLTRHLAAFDGTAVAADSYKIVIPRSGTLKNLSLKALPASTINGTGHSAEVLINGASAPTPLLVTWNSPPAGTPPYAPPTTATASVNAGDVVSLRLKTKGTSGVLSRPTVSVELEVDSEYPNPWDFDPNTGVISYSGGDVEVGTPTTNDALTVHGMITTNEGIRFPDGSIQVEAASPAAGALHSLDAADGNPVDAVFVAAGGNVGIGIDPTQRTPQEELTLAPSFNLATEIPTPNVVTASPIGGTLPPGDYTFWVSASDGTGWTKASDPYLRTLPSTNGGLRITWGPVLGATKYRLYRVVNSVPTEYKYVETPTNTYDYSDDGPFTPDAPPYSSPPAQSTAYINKLSASGPSWLLGGNLGIGTSTPVVPLHIKGPRGTIYLDGSPGSQVYYLNNGTPEWCLGTQTGQPTQDLMLFNYRTLSIAFVVNRDTNWITVVAGLSAPGFTSSSSKRWKKNIQTISGALGIVKRLRGISYSQKDDDKRNIGLIAEEVGEVIPEIVTFEENGTDAQGLDYSRLVAVLIEAAKEQQEQIEELKAAVRSLLAWKQETRDTRVAERA